MPWAKVVYQGKGAHPEVLQKLRMGLQEVIAQALTVPGRKEASLVKDDVELMFEPGSPLNIGKDVQILVLANHYTERYVNLQERTEKISRGVVGLLISTVYADTEPVEGFVYVRLAEAGFAKF